MKRYSNEQLIENGFVRFNHTNAMVLYYGNEVSAIASYGLIVARYSHISGSWESAEGFHDFSSTTAKQVTQITGDNTNYRRRYWKMRTQDEFEALTNLA